MLDALWQWLYRTEKLGRQGRISPRAKYCRGVPGLRVCAGRAALRERDDSARSERDTEAKPTAAVVDF